MIATTGRGPPRRAKTGLSQPGGTVQPARCPITVPGKGDALVERRFLTFGRAFGPKTAVLTPSKGKYGSPLRSAGQPFKSALLTLIRGEGFLGSAMARFLRTAPIGGSGPSTCLLQVSPPSPEPGLALLQPSTGVFETGGLKKGASSCCVTPQGSAVKAPPVPRRKVAVSGHPTPRGPPP